MEKAISSVENYQQLIKNSQAILIYFSHENCHVCKILKPKIIELLAENFPKISFSFSDTVKYPEIAAQNSIFAVPTILVYLEGKEFLRRSRNIGIEELKQIIERPYKLLFE